MSNIIYSETFIRVKLKLSFTNLLALFYVKSYSQTFKYFQLNFFLRCHSKSMQTPFKRKVINLRIYLNGIRIVN